METFTPIGYPTLVFRVTHRYSIGKGRYAIHCVVGQSDDGRRTAARVADVVFGGARC
jgi:hypothetical protein